MFHMVTVFPLSWVFLSTDETPARFLMIEAIAAVFGFGAIIASGTIADCIGRRTLLGVTAAEVGRASCRERVWRSGSISVVGGSLKTKNNNVHYAYRQSKLEMNA